MLSAQKRQAIGILSIIVDQRGEDVPVIPQAGIEPVFAERGSVSEKSRERKGKEVDGLMVIGLMGYDSPSYKW